MREILFRAKRIDYDKFPKEEWWIEGNAFVHDDGRTVDISTGTEKFSINKRVIPETLCQYTGLKDKNGNRIWENDIVSCEHAKYPEDNPSEVYPLLPNPIRYKRSYVVEFINTGSSYGYRLRNRSIHFMITGNVIYNHKVKVIGNIFDNPELLEKQ